MKRIDTTRTYGEALLDYVPLCFDVALALTKDSERAQKLTLDTVAWVWQERANDNNTRGMKSILLTELRNRHSHNLAAATAVLPFVPTTFQYLQTGSPFPAPSV